MPQSKPNSECLKKDLKKKVTYTTAEGKGRKITSVCFPSDLYERLEKQARKINMKISTLVVLLAENFVEYEEDLEKK